MDRGLRTLLTTYWSGGGWYHRAPAAEAFEAAKAEGYMFPPSPERTHDETLQALRAVLERISPADVAEAFLYSLSTRQLQYRSALGSYYYARAIPEHRHGGAGPCHLCAWRPVRRVESPEMEHSGCNVFNFERYKWGGVRHTQPEYALFDLEQFLLLPKVASTQEDRALLLAVLHEMDTLPPEKKAGAYRAAITKGKLLKSNKDEAAALLNILGVCGVLSGAEAPCYEECFVDEWGRAPVEHSNDYEYPVNRWHVSDGVDEERFRRVFGFGYSD